MAEAYLRFLTDKSDKKLTIKSAGMAANPGLSANPLAIKTLEKIGIDLFAHKSQALTSALLEKTDILVPLANSHIYAIINDFPQYADKIKPLTNLAGEILAISDPFGGSLETYSRCFNMMKPAIERLFKEL